MRKYETHAFICKLIFTKHIDPITFFLYTIKPKHDAHPFLIGLKLSLSKGLTSFWFKRYLSLLKNINNWIMHKYQGHS